MLLYTSQGLCVFSPMQTFLPGQAHLLCLPHLAPSEGAWRGRPGLVEEGATWGPRH